MSNPLPELTETLWDSKMDVSFTQIHYLLYWAKAVSTLGEANKKQWEAERSLNASKQIPMSDQFKGNYVKQKDVCKHLKSLGFQIGQTTYRHKLNLESDSKATLTAEGRKEFLTHFLNWQGLDLHIYTLADTSYFRIKHRPNHLDSNLQAYTCTYWRENMVGKALFIFNTEGGLEWKRMRMVLDNSKLGSDFDKQTRREDYIMSGEVESVTENNLFCKLSEIDGEAQIILSMVIFKTTQALKDRRIFKASYSTVRRGHAQVTSTPVSGIMLFELIDTKEELEIIWKELKKGGKRLYSKLIEVEKRDEDDLIFQYLFNKRLEINHGVDSLNDLPNYKNWERLKQIVGHYDGYYLNVNHSPALLSNFSLDIQGNGFAELHNMDRIYKGVCKFHIDKPDIITIGIQHSKVEDNYRLKITLWKDPLVTGSVRLVGVYSGVEFDESYPISGRVFLERSEVAKKDGSPDFKSMPLSKDKSSEFWQLLYSKPALFTFLYGLDRSQNYTDGFTLMKETLGVEFNRESIEPRQEFPYAGAYHVFYSYRVVSGLSQVNRSALVSIPLKINKDGSFLMRGRDNEKIVGRADEQNYALSLVMEKNTTYHRRPPSGFFLFSTSGLALRDIKTCSGIFIRLSVGKVNVVATRCLLLRVDSSENFDLSNFSETEINSKKLMAIEVAHACPGLATVLEEICKDFLETPFEPNEKLRNVKSSTKKGMKSV